MVKKALSGILCVFLAVIMSACENAVPPSTDTTAPPEETDTATVTASAPATTAQTTETAEIIEVPVTVSKELAMDKNEIEYIFTESEYYHNYIELYDKEGNFYRIGDPYVMRYNGMYYLYSSITSGHIGGDIYVWQSENLVDWKCLGICLTSDGKNGVTYTAYAPEVVYYHGYFWLCEAPNGQGHYIFRSESPAGPFTKVSGNLGKGIDGSFYLDDTGKLYFLYAKSGASGGNIRYDAIDVEAKTDASMIKSGNGSPLTASCNGWTEGPGYFRRGDYFYLTYTGNHVRDKSYRVAYSYTTSSSLINGLVQPKDNITVMSTDLKYPNTNGGYGSGAKFDALNIFSGTGHSSNTIGPDLDSVYTAFHNEESGTFNRRMNVIRYFTNSSLLHADGFALTSARKPKAPDYAAKDAGDLTKDGIYLLSADATEKIFTAEINFTVPTGNTAELVVSYTDSNNYTAVIIENDSVKVTRYTDGSPAELGTAGLGKGNKYDSVCTVRVVNGADKCEIYFNNMRKLVLNAPLSAGKIGISDVAAKATCLFFTNDAFGTSDFEAVKNLPASFPAFSYLKGENRGFSIANAKVTAGGVRQGEKESTVTENGYTAVKLSEKDWVKYAASFESKGFYAMNLTVTSESAGAEFEVIIDGESIYTMKISDAIAAKSGCHAVQAGLFYAEGGEHTLKIRVTKGTLEFITVTVEGNAEPLEPISSDLTGKISRTLSIKSGNYTVSSSGLKTISSDVALFEFGNSGISDFEMSVDVKIKEAFSEGGIIFRMSDFNVNTHSGSEYFMNGYYLMFRERKVTLWKYAWNYGEKIGSVAFLPGTKDRVYKEGEAVSVKIKAVDGQLTVLINGIECFSYYDNAAFLSGSCALYADKATFIFTDLEYKQTAK